MDAIMLEQASYKRIVYQMVKKFQHHNKDLYAKEVEIADLRKYQVLLKKEQEENLKQKSELKCQTNQIDKLKIALIQFDQHVRDEVVVNNEFMIQ
jgi:hypothetical protein